MKFHFDINVLLYLGFHSLHLNFQWQILIVNIQNLVSLLLDRVQGLLLVRCVFVFETGVNSRELSDLLFELLNRVLHFYWLPGIFFLALLVYPVQITDFLIQLGFGALLPFLQALFFLLNLFSLNFHLPPVLVAVLLQCLVVILQHSGRLYAPF